MLLRPDVNFLSRPFIEDAFYSLSVARSIGHGHGLTIDGVTPTNGVQPLICYLYAPAFAIAGDDIYLALRIVLGLQVIFAGLAALAVARFAVTIDRVEGIARSELFWLVAGTIAMSYSMLVHLQNGLETSLAVALVFMATIYYIERIARRSDASFSGYALLGLLLGLAVLARIDTAILAVAIALWHVITRRTGRAVAGMSIAGLVALLVSLPWWLYNLIGFGHLMPTSGLAQQDLDVDRLRSIDLVVRGVFNAMMVVMHAPGDTTGAIGYVGLYTVAALIALVLAIAPLRRVARSAVVMLRAELRARDAAPLAIFAGSLAIYYALFFGAPHFIPRYLIVLWLAIATVVLALLYAMWRAAPDRTVRPLMLGALGFALGASVWAQSRNFTREGIYSNPMLHPAEWIAAHTRESDRIGMFQSGTTGFLYARVTNLDGKVNPRALAAQKEGRLARFVDSASFDYIIDLDFYTRHIFGDTALRNRYQPVDTLPRDFIVWRRVR